MVNEDIKHATIDVSNSPSHQWRKQLALRWCHLRVEPLQRLPRSASWIDLDDLCSCVCEPCLYAHKPCYKWDNETFCLGRLSSDDFWKCFGELKTSRERLALKSLPF